MSDFDKEAERERLREKYEREEEKRQVTERMSELLLKGATMTNAHCQDCGDPIFRYDGQEFCATCQKTVSRQTEAETDAEDGDDAGEEIEVATPEDTRVQFGGDGEASTEGSPTTASESDQPADDEPSTADESAGYTDLGRAAEAEPAAQGQTPTTNQRPASAESGDLSAARGSLTRSVTTLAQQAENAEDLGRKRDLLAATREAADALAAVREATR